MKGNYKTIIAKMGTTQTYHEIKGVGAILKGGDDSIYFIPEKNIGKGSYGEVFHAYSIKKDGSVEDKTSKVIKIIPSGKFSDQEFISGSRYIKMSKFTITKKSNWLFQEKFTCIVQDNLGKSLYDLRKEIKDLPPKIFLSLIKLIAQKINDLHHSRLDSGDPSAHCDLHLGNILVDIIRDGDAVKELKVNIIDFGRAIDLETGDHTVSKQLDLITDDERYPKEAREGEFGLKTDIYQLANILTNLFENGNREDKIRGYNIPGNFKRGLATRFGFEDDVTKIIVRFINLMQSEDKNKRPDSDKVLKFFTTLDTYYKVCEREKGQSVLERSDKFYYSHILSSLASGTWEQNSPSSLMYSEMYSETRQSSKPEEKKQDQQKIILSEEKVTLFTKKDMAKPVEIQKKADSIEAQYKDHNKEHKLGYVLVPRRSENLLDTIAQKLKEGAIHDGLKEGCDELKKSPRMMQLVCIGYPQDTTHFKIQEENLIWSAEASNKVTDLQKNKVIEPDLPMQASLS